MPKLHIVYSSIYDLVVQEWRAGITKYNVSKLQTIEKRVWNRKNIQKHRQYATNLQEKWNGIGNKVFSTMQQVSGLNWQEKYITCYILDTVQSFSDPMTVRVYNDWNWDCEGIIHELGHRLEFQNLNRINWKKFNKEFGKENQTVQHHILLHAILKLTYLKIFNIEKTMRYIKGYKLSDYKRAWDIVEGYGAENLIRNFIKQAEK